MILRQLSLRHGLLAFRSTPWPSRRLLSTTFHPFADGTTQQDALLNGGNHVDLVHSSPSPTSGDDESLAPSSPTKRGLPDVSDDYERFMGLYRDLIATGATVKKQHLEMSTAEHVLEFAPQPRDVTLELLLASQTHMGHNKSLWNPANSRYIYGVRQGVHMISLEQTAAHLRRAARVVEEVALRGGLVLFVGTRAGHMPIVGRAAELAGGCHLFEKWRPGTITNRDVILRGQPIAVVNEHDQKLAGFRLHTTEMVPLVPDLIVCLNPVENFTMLYECGLKSIPTIGVIDTNADPSWVTYAIPANDDSLRSLAVIACVLGRAGQAGRDRRLGLAKDSKIVTWRTPRTTRDFISRRQSRRRRAEASGEKFDVFSEIEKPEDEADEEAMWLGIEEKGESFGEMSMLDVLADAQGPEQDDASADEQWIAETRPSNVVESGAATKTIDEAGATEATGAMEWAKLSAADKRERQERQQRQESSMDNNSGMVAAAEAVIGLDDLDRLLPLSKARAQQAPASSSSRETRVEPADDSVQESLVEATSEKTSLSVAPLPETLPEKLSETSEMVPSERAADQLASKENEEAAAQEHAAQTSLSRSTSELTSDQSIGRPAAETEEPEATFGPKDTATSSSSVVDGLAGSSPDESLREQQQRIDVTESAVVTDAVGPEQPAGQLVGEQRFVGETVERNSDHGKSGEQDLEENKSAKDNSHQAIHGNESSEEGGSAKKESGENGNDEKESGKADDKPPQP